MKIIFLDNNGLISSSFDDSSRCEQTTQAPDGRRYQFLETRKECYSSTDRICLLIQVVAKTLFSLGFKLLCKEVREDWKVAFSGKRDVPVYVPLNENHQTITQLGLELY